ncbi:single-stranded DNA-binding protein [Aquisphaera insulae]|uniref:single-stranded DNA-binding protein n=1 Tax=Aquisphaera insulae TaxID=2712864 RepID=UPI0013ECD2B1|nr:single-stranded DNA-binding protein [Aquisphaera insulae]
MADLNKVFLMGRLTFDPELRRTPGGTAVAELRMATSRGWTDREGSRREETLFIDVTVWDRAAENCCQYLRKGSQIHVEGSLKMDTWEDKTTGQKREKIRVHADRVQFLDSRRSDSGGGGGDYGDEDGASAPAPAREPAPRRSSSPSPANGAGAGAGRGGYSAGPRTSRPAAEPEQEEDDIPF